MKESTSSEDSLVRRQSSARRALEGYRERRRRRRGDDTYFGSADLLRAAAEDGVSVGALDHRRRDVVEEAQADGIPVDLAELLYDVAREEGLDPAIGLELVKTGLGVAPPPEGLSTESDSPMADRYLPPWIFPASPTDQVLRERMLRVSFRRLRSMLQREESPDLALQMFAREPDVGHYGY